MSSTLGRFLGTLIATTALVAAAPVALPQNLMQVKITEAGGSPVSQALSLPINKSAVVELAVSAGDIIIANPAIADAFVQTDRRFIFRGIETGKTNAFIFDRNGNQIVNLEITVEQDISDLEVLVKRLVPDARVFVQGVNGNIVLTGRAENLAQADQILRLVRGYLPDPATQIVNLIQVNSNDQVMLQVRVVEMQRSVVKQLGVNLSGGTSFGELASQSLQQLFQAGPGGALLPVVDADGNPVEALLPSAPWTNNGNVSASDSLSIGSGLDVSSSYQNYVGDQRQSNIGAAVEALERVGLVRTLAEPNLATVSGESANFLAGGEFPVPVGQKNDGTVTIEFKKFGVGLGFTPVVLSEDRISLRISVEVSELTSEGAYVQGSASGTTGSGDVLSLPSLTIPALKVRRVENTVELPSGGSMMIAGLIQADTRQTLDGIPGAKDIPILGALFRSREFVNQETELVIIVTPYLVDPARIGDMRTPVDGLVNPSDLESTLFGKLNRVYGTTGSAADGTGYNAPVGFIEE